MELFDGFISVQKIAFLMFSILVVAAVGYIFGRITVKGVCLGTAGVFIMALVFGAFFYEDLATALQLGGKSYSTNALKIVENIGLVFFVTSVGFIAGPKFFKNLAKNFKSYITIGLIIILSGGAATYACYVFDRNTGEKDKFFSMSMMDGLLSGALTSTPAFAASKATVVNLVNTPSVALELGSTLTNKLDAKEIEKLGINDAFFADLEAATKVKGKNAAEITDALSTPTKTAMGNISSYYENIVTVGHGIAYLFGVVGVVLFVQIIPKITGANMEEERRKIVIVDTGAEKSALRKLLDIDPAGLGMFGLAAACGVVLGAVKVPLTGQGLSGTTFALTTTGGTLIAALLFGHIGHIGSFNLVPHKKTLECLREFGLMMFLIGAGIAGGADFVKYFKWSYFFYGIFMTIVPMIIGYLFARYVLKLFMLNNLGSITGGMTSTPALGTLIQVSGTDDVASAYAATYPIALLSIVLISQFLLMFVA